VAIPAFAETFIALGTWEDAEAEESEVAIDSELVASIAAVGDDLDAFISIAPGKTEDGPGWLTHPVDTNRLRNYWTRGPGAAKIGWGTPGDFNRCRLQLAKYIKPQHLSGYCANRHYDALKTWPGRHAADTMVASAEQSPALSLVASVTSLEPREEAWAANLSWYEDPGLTEPTPLTVTDDGRIFGHLAVWGTCHIGFDGVCIEPPSSPSNYANFRLGTVQGEDGTVVPVGRITLGTGHASTRLSAARALEHYDNTGTCVGYVAAGEDGVGIWIAGQVAPGVTENQVTILRAASLSGDWRDSGHGIDLRAALAVNVPGFPIQHPSLAASAGRQTALVAAGVVPHQEDSTFAVAKAAAKAAIEEIRSQEKAAKEMAALRDAHYEKKMAQLRRGRMLATHGRS
jgi:hypothetical protein